MRFNKNYKKISLSIVAAISGLSLHAQTATDAAALLQPTVPIIAVILMVIVASLLAFVIWGLSSVLIMYARKALEKSKEANKVLPLLLLVGFSLLTYTCKSAGYHSAGNKSGT